jgi:hypothetical protein
MKMIQNKILTIILLLLIINCKQTVNVSKDQLSVESVIKEEKFEEGSGIHYLALKFDGNGLFEFIYNSEGWDWETKGQYSIIDNKVILKAIPCPDSSNIHNQCSNSFNDGVCSIQPTVTGFEYRFIFECISNEKFEIFTQGAEPSNRITFDIKKLPFPNGTKKKFNGFDIETLGNTSATVTTPVVLREGPGTNFPKLDYIVNVYDGPILSSLPEGKVVTVHARTPKKQKVKNWENYWYLISIDDTRYVWAFAEFFK